MLSMAIMMSCSCAVMDYALYGFKNELLMCSYGLYDPEYALFGYNNELLMCSNPVQDKRKSDY